jgi:CRP-like cAMP-binding protein
MPDLPDMDTLKANSKLFALLDEVGREKLLAVGVEVEHPDGDLLGTRGEQSDAFFLVLEGAVSVYVEGDTKLVEVTRLERGSFFGELATLLGEKRAAFAKARGDVRALRFDTAKVALVMRKYPKVMESLVRIGIKRSEKNLDGMLRHDFSDMPVTVAEDPHER